MITAVIIDDEEISRKTLKNLLTEYFPNVEVLAMAASVDSGVNALERFKPQLVFLDIAMPDGNGFSVLEKTKHLNYRVIFITAYHDYAIKAFDFSALHYLLKPINIEELEKAIARFQKVENTIEDEYQLDILKQSLNNDFRKIALPTNDSILFVDLDEIIRCEASHNYTIFYLKNSGTVVMSRSLQHYEKMLSPFGFYRVHDKHLVNVKYVSKYIRGKGGYAQLTDGSEVEVSVRKKEEFLKKVTSYPSRIA